MLFLILVFFFNLCQCASHLLLIYIFTNLLTIWVIFVTLQASNFDYTSNEKNLKNTDHSLVRGELNLLAD